MGLWRRFCLEWPIIAAASSRNRSTSQNRGSSTNDDRSHIRIEQKLEIQKMQLQTDFKTNWTMQRVLRRLINQMKRKDEEHKLKKMMFLHYDYVETDDDNKPLNENRFKNPMP